MNRYEVFNNIKIVLFRQLKKHWHWIRKKEDVNDVIELFEEWINRVNPDKYNKKAKE